MTNTEIAGIREMAQTVCSDGRYQVVVEKTVGKKTVKEVKMFGLTYERAHEYTFYYRNSRVELMA